MLSLRCACTEFNFFEAASEKVFNTVQAHLYTATMLPTLKFLLKRPVCNPSFLEASISWSANLVVLLFDRRLDVNYLGQYIYK